MHISKILDGIHNDFRNGQTSQGTREERTESERRVIFGPLFDDEEFMKSLDDVLGLTLIALEDGIVSPRTAFNQLIQIGRHIERQLTNGEVVNS